MIICLMFGFHYSCSLGWRAAHPRSSWLCHCTQSKSMQDFFSLSKGKNVFLVKLVSSTRTTYCCVNMVNSRTQLTLVLLSVFSKHLPKGGGALLQLPPAGFSILKVITLNLQCPAMGVLFPLIETLRF